MNRQDFQIAFQAGWKSAALDCRIELQAAILQHQQLSYGVEPDGFPEFIRFLELFREDLEKYVTAPVALVDISGLQAILGEAKALMTPKSRRKHAHRIALNEHGLPSFASIHKQLYPYAEALISTNSSLDDVSRVPLRVERPVPAAPGVQNTLQSLPPVDRKPSPRQHDQKLQKIECSGRSAAQSSAFNREPSGQLVTAFPPERNSQVRPESDHASSHTTLADGSSRIQWPHAPPVPSASSSSGAGPVADGPFEHSPSRDNLFVPADQSSATVPMPQPSVAIFSQLPVQPAQFSHQHTTTAHQQPEHIARIDSNRYPAFLQPLPSQNPKTHVDRGYNRNQGAPQYPQAMEPAILPRTRAAKTIVPSQPHQQMWQVPTSYPAACLQQQSRIPDLVHTAGQSSHSTSLQALHIQLLLQGLRIWKEENLLGLEQLRTRLHALEV